MKVRVSLLAERGSVADGGDGGEDRLDRTCGRETSETWEPATSVIVAPARSAIWRWVSGGMTRSSVPITAQLGTVFHAAAPDGWCWRSA